jgi:hypothetical protein
MNPLPYKKKRTKHLRSYLSEKGVDPSDYLPHIPKGEGPVYLTHEEMLEFMESYTKDLEDNPTENDIPPCKKDLRFCGYCSIPSAHKCAGCKLFYYCSSACQQAHWPIHRGLCKLHKRAPSTIRTHLNCFVVEKLETDRIPLGLLTLKAWQTLGITTTVMLSKLWMAGWEQAPCLPEKTNLLRELMGIGAHGMLDFVKTGYKTKKCFGLYYTRVKYIGNQLRLLTQESDPGYIDWIFSCDMLSLPDWTHTELRALWDGDQNSGYQQK